MFMDRFKLLFILSIFSGIILCFSCTPGGENIPIDDPPQPEPAEEEVEIPINTPSEGGGTCTLDTEKKYYTYAEIEGTINGAYTFTCYAGASEYTENDIKYTKLFFNEGIKEVGKGMSIEYVSGSGVKKIGLISEGAEAEIKIFLDYQNGTYSSMISENKDAFLRVVDTDVEGEYVRIYYENITVRWKVDKMLITAGETVVPRAKNDLEIANYRTCDCN